MNLFITGGTGLVGSTLIGALTEDYKVTVLTRDTDHAREVLGDRVRLVTDLDELKHLNEFDIVLNLAGEPIADKRWTARQKEKICQSRWHITDKLSELIQASEQPPVLFISGSAVGYYGRQGNKLVTEDETHCYDEFSHKVCAKWEKLALRAESEQTRVCLLRTGIVLSDHGGALQKMLPAFRFGLGGPISKGDQYMSWIHLQDMISAIRFLMVQGDAKGPYNLTAPEPVTNEQFSRTLAETLNRPCLFRVPAFMLRLMFGEMADLLLYGQRVLPRRLEQAGFHFRFQQLPGAMTDLLS
ncbi:Protein Rcp [Saliniradius amylolyticus]|uniref:Protein Rcp n=1 Tax=Saliniradius amylolyticus TaxID=2183582 RepID=A0A2S2E2F2_9ALTE|nr:TIGR01777 family oxidoreductase [Saliniradius amylolyticus]AWL11702.1 Protein Rcp [Saliniradius amylolyticus]